MLESIIVFVALVALATFLLAKAWANKKVWLVTGDSEVLEEMRVNIALALILAALMLMFFASELHDVIVLILKN